MDKDSIVIIVLLTLLASLFIGLPYGTYKYGRFAERRALTDAFVETMAQDYKIGYDDGKKDGITQGVSTGRALGRMEILAEEDDGRY